MRREGRERGRRGEKERVKVRRVEEGKGGEAGRREEERGRERRGEERLLSLHSRTHHSMRSWCCLF